MRRAGYQLDLIPRGDMPNSNGDFEHDQRLQLWGSFDRLEYVAD